MTQPSRPRHLPESEPCSTDPSLSSASSPPSFSSESSSPVFVIRPPTESDFSDSEAAEPGVAFKPPSALDSFPLPPSSTLASDPGAPQSPPSPPSSEQALEARFPSFASLDLHPVLVERLKQLQVEAPTATQVSAFLLIDKGRDCVIVDRTGTGKTLAYLLPFMNKIYKLHDLLLHAQIGPGEAAVGRARAATEGDGTCADGECERSLSRPADEAAAAPGILGRDSAQLHERDASLVKAKSVGRMLQDQLMRRQDEVLARHAALSPTPQVWECLRSASRGSSSPAALAEPNAPPSLHDDALQAAGLSPDSPNPLGSLRPAVLLLPTHDMVIDTLHTLRRLDVLGRMQIQCLSGVERNVRERTAGATDARDVQELRRKFRRPDAAEAHMDGVAGDAVAAELGDGARDPFSERARRAGTAGGRESAEESRKSWASATVSGRGERDRERREGDAEDGLEGEADESADQVVWQGQVLRRPRLTPDGKLVTETRPFSQKKIKNIHEVHVLGSERSGVRESWRSQALRGDGADKGANSHRAETAPDGRRRQGCDESDDEPAIQVCSLPVLHKPRIRWGAVDLVISTPHLFLEDVERFRGENLQPSMLILDEVDDLLRARASRTLLMDILGYCRPRVPIPAPHTAKPALPDFRPCQVIFSGATLASLGPCSPGVMIIERFGNAFEVSPRSRHQLRDEVKQLWIRLNAERVGELLALAQPPWRAAEPHEEDKETRTAGGHVNLGSTGSAGDEVGVGGRRRRIKGGLITGSALAEERKKEFLLLGGNLPVYLKRRNQPSDEAVALASRLVAETSPHTNVQRKLRQQVSWDHRVDILLGLLAAFPVERTVVFVNSVERCIRLFDFFRDRAWPVVSFHRKMSMKHRTRALARLLAAPARDSKPESDSDTDVDEDSEGERFGDFRDRLGRPRGQASDRELLPASLMIATDLACRGLDLQGVQHVINFDFPTDALAYIHRAGRTCRRPSSSRSVDAAEERRSGFCLVSNLVSDDDFPLASSLYFLQKENQNLESTFSRKASFKARYIRHREAEKKRKAEAGEQQRQRGAGSAEGENEAADLNKGAYVDDIEQLWNQMYRMQFARKARGDRERRERGAENGVARTPRERRGRGVAEEGAEEPQERGERGRTGAEPKTPPAGSSPEASAALCRGTGKRRRRLRGQLAERVCPKGGFLSYREAEARRRQRLVDRLLTGAVWSEDGRTACIEAPRSFFEDDEEAALVGIAEQRGDRGPRGSFGSDGLLRKRGGSSPGAHVTHPAPGGGRRGEEQTRLACEGKAHGASTLPEAEADGDGEAEQGQRCTGARHSERTLHPGGNRVRALGTSRALQMRAALFDDDSEDEDNLHARAYSAQLSPDSASSPSLYRSSAMTLDGTSRDARDADAAGCSVGAPERAAEEARLSAGREVWTEEEYDKFVVRRFEAYQDGCRNRARGHDPRLASVTRLHQKAAEMRTKMLMNNFGASDDFFDEDLKV
ncbi:hypothetical protein NCLIV_021230 [Neospora caninum Liverpool]|nr:hypothetical protein NCLIV_021230 [Neospora caninum Liverpool]CBZ52335.1 hypothetical protein NCLIV_021230 [Neospora caninum Liverpool]|eukprot:XP_003882367.1 hypothetical protein NCLIV_021230 [Neospora caninum Liverpool]